MGAFTYYVSKGRGVGGFDDRLLFLTGGEWRLGRGSLSADVSSDHGHFQ